MSVVETPAHDAATLAALAKMRRELRSHRRAFRRHVKTDDRQFAAIKARVNILLVLVLAILPMIYVSGHT